VEPIEWPPDAWIASIPQWAWRAGHPAIPDDVREEFHAMAERLGARSYLPAP
jgi:hypothetical protein